MQILREINGHFVAIDILHWVRLVKVLQNAKYIYKMFYIQYE